MILRTECGAELRAGCLCVSHYIAYYSDNKVGTEASALPHLNLNIADERP